jgi:hypothetical protein
MMCVVVVVVVVGGACISIEYVTYGSLRYLGMTGIILECLYSRTHLLSSLGPLEAQVLHRVLNRTGLLP